MLTTDLSPMEVAILRYLNVPVTHVQNCDSIKDRTLNEVDEKQAEAKLHDFSSSVRTLEKRIEKANKQTA